MVAVFVVLSSKAQVSVDSSGVDAEIHPSVRLERIKSTGCSSWRPEFDSQRPHGDSQPSIMRSCALFWPAGVHAGRTLYM